MKTLLILLGLMIIVGIFIRRYQMMERGLSSLPLLSKHKRPFHRFHHEDPSSEVTLQEMIPGPETVNSRNAIKASTLLKKADAALAKGDMKTAEQFTIQSIALNPSLKEAYGKLGLLYLSQHQFGKAEMIFRRLILGEVQEASYFSNLGLALYQQSKLPEARTFYEKAIEMDASRAGRFFSLAKILHELNEFDLALQHFKKAVEMDPKNLDYLLTLADFYRERQMWQEGRSFMAHVADIFPREERVMILSKEFQDQKSDHQASH